MPNNMSRIQQTNSCLYCSYPSCRFARTSSSPATLSCHVATSSADPASATGCSGSSTAPSAGARTCVGRQMGVAHAAGRVTLDRTFRREGAPPTYVPRSCSNTPQEVLLRAQGEPGCSPRAAACPGQRARRVTGARAFCRGPTEQTAAQGANAHACSATLCCKPSLGVGASLAHGCPCNRQMLVTDAALADVILSRILIYRSGGAASFAKVLRNAQLQPYSFLPMQVDWDAVSKSVTQSWQAQVERTRGRGRDRRHQHAHHHQHVQEFLRLHGNRMGQPVRCRPFPRPALVPQHSCAVHNWLMTNQYVTQHA